METPKAYFTTSAGKWAVIYGGMPLCAHTDRETARKVAVGYSLNADMLPVWDGDAGEFRS